MVTSTRQSARWNIEHFWSDSLRSSLFLFFSRGLSLALSLSHAGGDSLWLVGQILVSVCMLCLPNSRAWGTVESGVGPCAFFSSSSSWLRTYCVFLCGWTGGSMGQIGLLWLWHISSFFSVHLFFLPTFSLALVVTTDFHPRSVDFSSFFSVPF